ncbi:MAG TPA: hypothetical protein VGZ32_26485 [Actinocrinis sp.]|jgi:hypothetical protein|uniref:hypothetical protein n=1 Tax=Actinocrinis sp. TaxID=1920516 RepID=UPI002DDD1B1D|nr:hypothetical protein [Actinocrinis sp.]HEV3173927.1 hypothetical protein [Actinocrinis sp.]
MRVSGQEGGAAGVWQWLVAVQRLRAVPAAYFHPTLDLAQAARGLGCDSGLVEELVRAGFPADETPEGLRFDYYDVMNLGLAAGLGRSLAEQYEQRCATMATGTPEDWSAQRSWRVRLGAPCTAPDCGGAIPAPPAPELLGGRLVEYQRSERNPNDAIAVVLTRGRQEQPRTDLVRRIHDELLTGLTTGRYQYSWLPDTLRLDPEAAAAHGMLDSGVAAWLMRRWALEAGLEVRTRKGYLLGLVGVEHAWAEVREQGRWLVLDPVLAFHALRRTPGGTDAAAAFAAFCQGSVHNHLLAWPGAANEPFTEHQCAAGGHIAYRCGRLPSATLARPVASMAGV